MNNTIDNFLEKENLVSLTSDGDSCRDNWDTCHICGFNTETYTCSGYSQKENIIKINYKVCHSCLSIISNGE